MFKLWLDTQYEQTHKPTIQSTNNLHEKLKLKFALNKCSLHQVIHFILEFNPHTCSLSLTFEENNSFKNSLFLYLKKINSHPKQFINWRIDKINIELFKGKMTNDLTSTL